MRRKATTWNYCWPDDPQPGLLHLEPPALSKKSSFSIQCGGGTSEEQDEIARRIAALWNAAEERRWTTEDIEAGVITPDSETRRIIGRLNDKYENVSRLYSQRGETIQRLEAEKAEVEHALGFAIDRVEHLEAEKAEMAIALNTMVEMVEMNGFGKHYALDLARAAIRKARGEE